MGESKSKQFRGNKMERFPAPAMNKSVWIKREDDAALEDQARPATEVHAARPFSPDEDALAVAPQQPHPDDERATIAGNLPAGGADNAIKNSALRNQQQQATLTLLPLVPGDLIRVEQDHPEPAVVGHAEGGGGDRCLILFPLAPGDIIRGNASGARVP